MVDSYQGVSGGGQRVSIISVSLFLRFLLSLVLSCPVSLFLSD